MLEVININTLIQLSFFAVGLSYVVTGSLIGMPLRVLGWWATRWCPLPLATIFFCPSCNAWWMGVSLGLWVGLPWQNITQLAFTSCVLAAIVQAHWNLAADDKQEIIDIFEKDKANDKTKGH